MTSDTHGVSLPLYDALKAGRGVYRLENWSSIAISGSDRASFLQNFTTNDIKRLGPGDACETFFLNVKGKVIGHGLVTCRDDEHVFVGAPGQAEKLIAHLDRYIIREDVQLRDLTTERRYLLVTGPIESSAPSFAWDLIGVESARIVETRADGKSEILQQLAERGIELVEQPEFEAARIEAGMPIFHVDFDENNLPQEVGRDQQAISFTKGCYLGQETVARIDALGHVNQQICRVRFEGAQLPAVGMEMTFDGTVVGHATSATYSPRFGGPLALAMLRRESARVGAKLGSAVGAVAVV